MGAQPRGLRSLLCFVCVAITQVLLEASSRLNRMFPPSRHNQAILERPPVPSRHSQAILVAPSYAVKPSWLLSYYSIYIHVSLDAFRNPALNSAHQALKLLIHNALSQSSQVPGWFNLTISLCLISLESLGDSNPSAHQDSNVYSLKTDLPL